MAHHFYFFLKKKLFVQCTNSFKKMHSAPGEFLHRSARSHSHHLINTMGRGNMLRRTGIVGLPFLAGTAEQLADTARVHMLIAIVLFVSWLYMAGLETSGLQATLGMAVMGIYLADMAGTRAGIGCTTIRFWMRFLSLAPLGSGFLPILLTRRRQAVHDMFAGCVVLKR